MAAERYAKIGRILRTFLERKRTKPDAIRKSVVQPALVVNDVLDNPGSRRPTDNHEYVLLFPGKHLVVPEILERRNKFRPRRVHPRHLVYEYDLAPFWGRGDQLGKSGKGIQPICKSWAFPISILHKRSAESIKLIA